MNGISRSNSDLEVLTGIPQDFAQVIQITPRVSGPLVKLPVEDNQFVEAGDLLFEIDRRTFEAALDQARAELDNTRDQIDALAKQVEAAQADVEAAVVLRASTCEGDAVLERDEPIGQVDVPASLALLPDADDR